MTRNDFHNAPIVFIPDAGEYPDTYGDVVNTLPVGLRPRIAPWEGSVESGQVDVEKLLDKHELRRIILVGGGRGAAVALRIAQAQPARITHLVLDSPVIALDRRTGRALRVMSGFLRRGRKREMIDQVNELSDSSVGDYADVATPTLVISGSRYQVPGARELVDALPHAVSVTIDGAGLRTYSTHPVEFGDHLGRFLQDSIS